MENEDIKSKAWVLERVRKLLTLGKDGGATDGERDVAMRMAHRLLAKYNLSAAEAEAHGTKTEEERKIHRATFFGRPWARVAAQAAAKLFFCEYLYMSATKGKDTTHYFIGKESNAITAAAFAEYLVTSIQREARSRNRDEGHDSHLWFRSFAMAAAVTIYGRVEKLIAESKDQKAEGPGTSIVLASVYETERAKNLVVQEKAFPKLKKGRCGSSDLSLDATSAGRRYGETISLNRQVEGGSRPSGLLR